MKKNDKLNILYEDKYILAVIKPHNLLTISTLKENEKTLYRYVSDYVKKQHKSNKVFIVHRLDKDTSGIILFAKNENVKKKLQENCDKTVRKYYALVYGILLKEGVIKNFLYETKTFKTYITNNKDVGKLAITKYKPVKHYNNKTLLDIEILTGRKNQIRVHMSSIAHPIVGDKKYGKLVNTSKILCLHAYYIEFIHPINNKKIILSDESNNIFDIYVNK